MTELNNTQVGVDAHVQRMLEEANQLSDRIGKLSVFTSEEGGKYDELPALEQHLLAAQLMAMQSYSAILDMRLKLSTDRGVFLSELSNLE